MFDEFSISSRVKVHTISAVIENILKEYGKDNPE